MALIYIVVVSLVAGGLISCQHTRIGDAPLIAGQSETTLLQLGILVDILQACHLLTRTLVNQQGRCLAVYILQHAVHGIFHTFLRGYAIALLIGRTHQVQRCIVVIHLLSTDGRRCQHDHHGNYLSHCRLSQKRCYTLVWSQIETRF